MFEENKDPQVPEQMCVHVEPELLLVALLQVGTEMSRRPCNTLLRRKQRAARRVAQVVAMPADIAIHDAVERCFQDAVYVVTILGLVGRDKDAVSRLLVLRDRLEMRADFQCGKVPGPYRTCQEDRDCCRMHRGQRGLVAAGLPIGALKQVMGQSRQPFDVCAVEELLHTAEVPGRHGPVAVGALPFAEPANVVPEAAESIQQVGRVVQVVFRDLSESGYDIGQRGENPAFRAVDHVFEGSLEDVRLHELAQALERLWVISCSEARIQLCEKRVIENHLNLHECRYGDSEEITIYNNWLSASFRLESASGSSKGKGHGCVERALSARSALSALDGRCGLLGQGLDRIHQRDQRSFLAGKAGASRRRA